MTGLMLFNYVVIGYFVLLNAVYFTTSLLAFRRLRRYAYKIEAYPDASLMIAEILPPITILAPAYNEEATCVESTHSLLALEYPDYEVVIINDGSRDETFSRLKEAFDLLPSLRMPTASLQTSAVRGIYHSGRIPNLWVIDKENGGKADALNCGINFCRTPLFCAVDADSLLEKHALTRIVRPFVDDESTVAVGGIIRIVNGCSVESGTVTAVRMPHKLLAKFQVKK